MNDGLTPKQAAIKEAFIKERGYWSTEIWDDVLQLDPDFLAAYLKFSAVPFQKNHRHIDLKTKELIYIAFDVAATHMYQPGTRQHMQNALSLGASPEEIMEVIELASVLGIHAATVGSPILLEVLSEQGTPCEKELTERQKQLKQAFIDERGDWSEMWDGILLLDPDFFEAYLEFSGVAFKHNHLDPKIREFICLAVDAAATHMYEPGIRLHMRNALKYGATKEEIMEVLELTSTLGIHAATVSVPILSSFINGRKA
ncbi:carboxymuconolactone decarboxylase family protein [Brevibacillus fulvus]|uniref:Alkylhydroperoxidase/carboxymuconolactone decarboxylase family protein YurZ n=1 Tax=Brevibacillus fulvus TaxID=1125967 RepID=A0A939BQT4_9BACL|nr:carboxymuconolactone decarboxylase family protein [Brevibacillus fulvus]MBM7588872.1 alkylhydroperoxidase/carboxymuconolactone decarboxylase family protein YurZ [Brevibacillus fulvus]